MLALRHRPRAASARHRSAALTSGRRSSPRLLVGRIEVMPTRASAERSRELRLDHDLAEGQVRDLVGRPPAFVHDPVPVLRSTLPLRAQRQIRHSSAPSSSKSLLLAPELPSQTSGAPGSAWRRFQSFADTFGASSSPKFAGEWASWDRVIGASRVAPAEGSTLEASDSSSFALTSSAIAPEGAMWRSYDKVSARVPPRR